MAKKKLFVTNGDESIHLHSENGTAYELAVGNDGALTVTNEETGAVSGGGSGLPTGGAAHQQLVTDADGNATWEDRTHYAATTVGVVLEEMTQEVPADDPAFVLETPPNINPVAGGKHTVIWNGVSYACDGVTMEDDGVQFVALGNAAAMGGDDTGEPFCMAFFPPDLVAQMGGGPYVAIAVLDSSTTVTVKVTAEVEEVKKIDEKYLDLAAKRVYTDGVVGSATTTGHIYRDPELTDELSFAEAYEILVDYGGKIWANTESMTTTGGFPFNPLVVQPMTGWGYFMVGLSDGAKIGRLNLYCSDYISEV